MKSGRIADMVALIGTSLGWIPPQLQQSLAAMPFLPQPVLLFNMVCTNVPGPMIPLYANGRELLTYYPHVPCGSDVGIGVAISSYNQNLYFGITYDAQAAPDGELFRDFLVECYEELRASAGVPAIAVKPALRRQPAEAGPVDALADQTVKARPEPEPVDAVVKPSPPVLAAESEPVAKAESEPAETGKNSAILEGVPEARRVAIETGPRQRRPSKEARAKPKGARRAKAAKV
jgi:hypothetical protein